MHYKSNYFQNLQLDRIALKIAILLCTTFLTTILFTNIVLGAPADSNATFDVTQPDGTKITLHYVGDEFNIRLVTSDGFTVKKSPDGWYRYAELNEGNLISSGRNVKSVEMRSTDDISFLENTEKSLGKDLNSDERSNVEELIKQNSQSGFSSITNFKVLLLLIDFPDLPHLYSQSDMFNLMEQDGYGTHGSFKQFYTESSYGQFIPQTTVSGWYTAANTHDYYGQDNGYVRAAELVEEAVNAAIANNVDFSQFDNNGDGFVDGLMVAFAGPLSFEDNGNSPHPHVSSIWNPIQSDGVTISQYSINPERYVYDQTQSNISIYCHEFGHQLGLPDLYGSPESVSPFGVMGSSSPLGIPQMCAWSKVHLGWVTPIDVYEDLSSATLLRVEDNQSIYRLWPNGEESLEYFLVENRHQYGFDTYLPGCGIAIWHIDDAEYSNLSSETFKVKLMRADDNTIPFETDLWQSGLFDENSIPNSNLKDGSSSGIKISLLTTGCNFSTDLGIEVGVTIDRDYDGILNANDNCPIIPNPLQADTDVDGVGDACDICEGFDDAVDTDNDAIPNGCDICEGYDDNINSDTDTYPDGCDNCPTITNQGQEDSDGDGNGNDCDLCEGYDDNINSDTDTYPDGCDNCPTITSQNQDDDDGDGNGNDCDLCEGYDDNINSDTDTYPNGCDNCPDVTNQDQADGDGDDVGDLCDNCEFVSNEDQADRNNDDIGDVCHTDIYVDDVNGNDDTGTGVEANPYKSINKGIWDADAGDIVHVMPGTYAGVDNTNLISLRGNIEIISVDGPENTTIDCGNNSRAFLLTNNETNLFKISGFSIINGNVSNEIIKDGGAIYTTSNPTIENCRFSFNQAENGGAVYYATITSSAMISASLFHDNTATINGGAIYISETGHTLENCTITENIAVIGAGVYVDNGNSTAITFAKCLIASNVNDGIYFAPLTPIPTFDCNIFWLNSSAHITGNYDFASITDANTKEADPQFCDIENNDFNVFLDSPCDPNSENNNCGITIGSLIGSENNFCNDSDKWRLRIQNVPQGYMGYQVPLSVTITPPETPVEIGKFDLRISFEPSAFAFLSAEPGEFIVENDWEYLSYRVVSTPINHMHIYGIADNGGGSPTGFYPTNTQELIKMNFLISNDFALSNMIGPFKFYWPDGVTDECDVNTLLNRNGLDILKANSVTSFDGSNIEITPTNEWSPDPVCIGIEEDDIDFYNGSIFIDDISEFELRGDINLNGLPFEIGDAVTFLCYFASGFNFNCFDSEHLSEALEATEIMCIDRWNPSIRDLVKLLQIIIGDSDPGCPGVVSKNIRNNVATSTSIVDTLQILNKVGEAGDVNVPVSLRMRTADSLYAFTTRFTYDTTVFTPVPETGDYLNPVKHSLSVVASDFDNIGEVIVQNPTPGEIRITFLPDLNLTARYPSGVDIPVNVYFDISSNSSPGAHYFNFVDDSTSSNEFVTVGDELIVPTLVSGLLRILVPILPSCPVLFSYDGEKFVEENTLLTECEQYGYKQSVVDYYHVTTPVQPDNSNVVFQIKEMEDEITYLDELELITVDHSPETDVFCSVDGKIFVYDQAIKPLSVIDQDGKDHLDELIAADDNIFKATDPGHLIVTFPTNSNNESGLYISSIPKGLCGPLLDKPLGKDVVVDDLENDQVAVINVEVLNIHGAWIPFQNLPSRDVVQQQGIYSDNSQLNVLQEQTYKISWNKAYEADVLNQLNVVEEEPTIQNWKINNVFSNSEDVSAKIWSGTYDDEVLTLSKDEMIEFSFKCDDVSDQNTKRDYIIRASGRYEPDYNVYSNLLPTEFNLYDNYPNPFNPTTNINFYIPVNSHIKLEIINLLGQNIKTLVNESQEAGHHNVVWDGKNSQGIEVSSGVYFYRISSESFTDTKKMMLLK